MDAHTLGTTYLLHFSRPYRHARHYLGWTVNLEERLDKHLQGDGARLVDVITAEGIGFELARVWTGTTLEHERRLKKQHNGPKLCPLCKANGNKSNKSNKSKSNSLDTSQQVGA